MLSRRAFLGLAAAVPADAASRPALAAEPVVGLGMRERDLIAAQVVLDKPG